VGNADEQTTPLLNVKWKLRSVCGVAVQKHFIATCP